MTHCAGQWCGFETTDMSRLGIVAALEREVRPLVRRWRVHEREHAGRRFRFYENGETVLVCGGVGAEPARRAAEAVLALYSPNCVYSVGYAGALEPTLRIGDILQPARVINAKEGSTASIVGGQGTLVSHALVASVSQKTKLREAYNAQAVDMESSAVARAAEARGVAFAAVKVISDEFNFELPPTEQFVDTQGRFQQTRFAIFIALRPWLWARVAQLARNSARATRNLCAELQKIVREEISVDRSAHGAGRH
jgi:adenosylhomocysteine nucleosidase